MSLTNGRNGRALWRPASIFAGTCILATASCSPAASPSPDSLFNYSDSSSPSPSATISATPNSEPSTSASASAVPESPHPNPTASVDQDNRTPITVSVTSATVRGSDVEVFSFVADKIENKGTCTLTLTAGDDSHEASRNAVPDASSTSCGRILFPVDKLSSGTWTGHIFYNSPASTGVSADFSVVIP